MVDDLAKKETALLDYIRQYKSALVAYSGGLDSTMVLWASVQALGPDKVYAATSESASFAVGEANDSKRFLLETGLPEDRHIFLTTDELDNPDYRKNASDRCYFCKSELFTKLREIKDKYNLDIIFDGSNASDTGDFRPGFKAGKELGVGSPLMEAGLTKEELRQMARKYSLSFSEKPAAACLASRLPYGIEVTRERLSQIERAEVAVRNLGFEGFRVRYHHEVARLELRPEDIERAMQAEIRKEIVDKLKGVGFKFVAIDLEGYSTGSLNRMIKTGDKTDER